MTFSSYDQRPCKSEVYRFVLWWHGAESKLVSLLKGMSCFPDWHQLILPQEILHILICIWSGYLDGTQGCSHSRFALRDHRSLSSALIRRNITQALLVGHVRNPSTWSGILRQEDCTPKAGLRGKTTTKQNPLHPMSPSYPRAAQGFMC